MCDRFALIVDASVLANVFDVDPPQDLEPRFNIAPTRNVPVVRQDARGHRACAMLCWGLVPSWAKNEKIDTRMM